MNSGHRPHRVVALSEIKGHPGPGSLTWHPVRVTFTIDGETHDAPADTYVFIPDPDPHRHSRFEPSPRAREILEEGLTEHPGSPRLMKALADLRPAPE